MNITRYQHGQMLGYAVTAYGIYRALDVVNVLWLSTMDKTSFLTSAVLPQALSGVVICLIALIAGYLIRGGAVDSNRNPDEVDPKIAGLLFVFLTLVSFPIGSILSAYVLLYLFVILPNDKPKPTEKDGI